VGRLGFFNGSTVICEHLRRTDITMTVMTSLMSHLCAIVWFVFVANVSTHIFGIYLIFRNSFDQSYNRTIAFSLHLFFIISQIKITTTQHARLACFNLSTQWVIHLPSSSLVWSRPTRSHHQLVQYAHLILSIVHNT
jgi:hypothetical protein